VLYALHHACDSFKLPYIVLTGSSFYYYFFYSLLSSSFSPSVIHTLASVENVGLIAEPAHMESCGEKLVERVAKSSKRPKTGTTRRRRRRRREEKSFQTSNDTKSKVSQLTA
jgi:hypothetical protein